MHIEFRLSSFFLSWSLSFAQCIALYCICIDGTPVSSYHLQLASHDMAKSEDNRKSKFLGLLFFVERSGVPGKNYSLTPSYWHPLSRPPDCDERQEIFRGKPLEDLAIGVHPCPPNTCPTIDIYVQLKHWLKEER